MNINEYVESVCAGAKSAAPVLAEASGEARNEVLLEIAGTLNNNIAKILEANAVDMANPDVPAKMRDRLMLDEKRIHGMSDAVRELVRLPDPLGSGKSWTRPNGLEINCVKVPLGVVGIICEARPNVTVDAAALCIKTGNACVLRGGKEAICTNRVLTELIRSAVLSCGLPENAVCLIDDITREGTLCLMTMRGYLDVLVPRGSASLIRSVTENARVPVIETGAGNCHVYVDKDADIALAVSVAVNAKVSRPSVCNAEETLLVHKDIAEKFLPLFQMESDGYGVELRGCERTCRILTGIAQATEEDYYTEYNDLILAVKVVDSLDCAIAHINKYNTGHSEAIITDSLSAARRFQHEVDAAAVYVNASTRFTDGGEFGFGAELGISTQKLHARGPMGPDALTTQKYLITGSGQIR